MARERRGHARGTEGLETALATAGTSPAAPQTAGKSKTKIAQDVAHPLPQERALFQHLIRALAREAARADDMDDSTHTEPRA